MMRDPDRLRLALVATLLLMLVALVGVVAVAFWPASSGSSASVSPGTSGSRTLAASPDTGITPVPTSGDTTLVAINQMAHQVPSAVASGESITVAIYVTVVPGADLIGGSLSFAFIPDGSTSEIAAQVGSGPAGPTLDPSRHVAQSFWVSFLVPSNIAGGTFVARLPAGTEVFRQHLTWSA